VSSCVHDAEEVEEEGEEKGEKQGEDRDPLRVAKMRLVGQELLS